MRLTLDPENTVMLHFRHLRAIPTPLGMPLATHLTTVALHFGDCPNVDSALATRICPALDDEIRETEIWRGEAFCSVRDEFVKATGRKIALTRALQEMDPPTRTKIWRAYWVALNQPGRAAVAGASA